MWYNFDKFSTNTSPQENTGELREQRNKKLAGHGRI